MSSFGPRFRKRHFKIGEDPAEGHHNDYRVGELGKGIKVVGIGFFQP